MASGSEVGIQGCVLNNNEGNLIQLEYF